MEQDKSLSRVHEIDERKNKGGDDDLLCTSLRWWKSQLELLYQLRSLNRVRSKAQGSLIRTAASPTWPQGCAYDTQQISLGQK